MKLYERFVKQKGCVGYISNRIALTTVRTVILYALAIGIYLIGYFTMHTNKSLWSIVAVLGILPASKSAVNMIMFFRYRSLKQEDAKEYADAAGELPLSYENIVTTKEKTYFLPALAYRNHTVCVFLNQEKLDSSKIENYLRESLKIEKIDATVKVFKNKQQFLDRVKALNALEPEEKDDDLRSIAYHTVQVISL